MTEPDWEGLVAVRGEHLLSFAATEIERQSILARWVQTGFEQGERFVYAEPVDHPPGHSLIALLTGQQLDAAAATQDGRLVRVSMSDFYSPGAPAAIAARAKADGFPAVRVAAQARYTMEQLGRASLIAYEGELARACETKTFSALCQYDPLSAGEWLTQVSQLHQLTGEGTPFFAVPADGGVMLFGEIDATNSAVMALSLHEASLLADGVLHVDLDGVQLLSAAGCRALLAGTEEFRARGGQVVLMAPRPIVSRVLRLVGLSRVPGVEIVDGAS